MRILHYHRALFDRSETFIRRYIEKSCQFGVVAACADKISDIPTHLSEEKVTYFELPEKYYSRKRVKGALRFMQEKLTGHIYRKKELAEFIRSFNPDVIHCHFGPMGIFMSEVLTEYNLDYPFATSFYGLDASSMPKNDPKYRSSLPQLWERGNAFFVEGPELGNKLVGLGADEVKIFINPLIVPITDYPQKENNTKKNTISLLMVGRFVEKKGFHLALEAIGLMKDQLPPFDVNLIGYGELEDAYKRIVQKYQLEHVVNFLGGKNHQEVIQALREHDIFLHPSVTASNGDSEGGAPTIIIEAEAVGIPVVSSDHADIPFVMGYHDFLAEEGNLKSLQDTILHAMNVEDWAVFTQQGRKKVLDQHNGSEQYYQNLSQLTTH